MKTIKTDVFTFDELSDAAKEKARDWYREGAFDYEWWDATYADAVECARLMGILVSESTETYSIVGKPGTKTRKRTDIYFSGFYSQGDGARFEGRWEPVADAVAAIKGHAPIDTELHRIAAELNAVRAATAGRLPLVRIGHQGHYEHSHTMTFEFEWEGEPQESDNEREERVSEALRDFADWIYRQLEKEWDYQNSDEAVDDAITANEYTFTRDGKRFG